MSTAKEILYGVKAFCEEKGFTLSVQDPWDKKLVFEAIREQWFPYVEFIDLHQKGFTNVIAEDYAFHNQGINPEFQDHTSDIFMLNID